MKLKIQCTKTYGMCKGSAKGKVIFINAYIKNQERKKKRVPIVAQWKPI